jgi:acetyltransferase
MEEKVSLKSFFAPKSIAIVGVSHEPQKVGYIVAKNIIDQGYQGELYFVNPHADKIMDKKVYKSLSEIGEKIELVVLAVPAQVAMKMLDEIHELKIHNIVLFAAGFKEMDEEGKKREEELYNKAKEYNLAVLGPNCLGYINTLENINATFLKHTCPFGNIAMVSQSGALGSAIVDQFIAHTNIGLSFFISLGNKTVLDESDCLDFLSQDSHTEVIGMYIENVTDGKKFRETLSKVTKIKPVVILKSGTTEEGSKAALSHTGGLAGNDQAYDAVIKQCGAIRASDYDEFVTILKMYSFQKAPTSPSILVLSNAGGVGVLLSDELIKNGLSLVTISEETKEHIEKGLETDGTHHRITIHNPIDLLGDASAFDYRTAILNSIQQQDIGAIIVLLTPQANTQIEETANALVEAQNHFIKPIYPVFMGEDSIQEAQHIFEEHRLVSFTSYAGLARTLQNVIASYSYVSKDSPLSLHTPAALSILANEKQIEEVFLLEEGKDFMPLLTSLQIMQLAGVPILPLYHIHAEEEVAHVVRKVNFPVVAKVASDKINHKTEAGGVISHIYTIDQLKKAYSQLSKLGTDGCYVQKMVSGYELFMGAKRDATFGPVIVFGLGGIYAELLKEVVELVYPFSLEVFKAKLEKTKVQRIIQGFRGTPPLNPQNVYNIAMQLGVLLSKYEQIDSIDINPLFASQRSLYAADCRIILKK